jgi:site-specific DNA-methyltransferase (adenine-specific)
MSDKVLLAHGKREELVSKMPDNSMDIVVQDPPFGVRDEIWDDRDAYIKKLRAWLWEDLRISKHAVIWFCAGKMMPFIFRAIYGHEEYFWRLHTWDKPEGTQFTGASNNNIWYSIEPILVFSKNLEITKSYGKNMPFAYDTFQYRTIPYKMHQHPTSKPVALMRKLIGHYSNPDETVFDGFGGSFSTAIAAIDMGRRIVSCEQFPFTDKPVCEDSKLPDFNPDYFNRGKARVQKHLDIPRLGFIGEPDDDSEDVDETLNLFEREKNI